MTRTQVVWRFGASSFLAVSDTQLKTSGVYLFSIMYLLCIACGYFCDNKVNVNQGKIVIGHGYFKIF